MKKPSCNITVFDSGLGGLSIVSHLPRFLPDARIRYLADHAFFPYGSRSPEDISERLAKILPEFIRQNPTDTLILACNTVSTQALDQVRGYLEIPVAGVVPAIKPATNLTRNKVIGLLATPATIASPYTTWLIDTYATGCKVIRQPAPCLAALAESFLTLGQIPDPGLLNGNLTSLREARPDTCVLACTHFPLISGALRKALPHVRFWTDPGEGVAKQVFRLLTGLEPRPQEHSKPSASGKNEIELFSTDPGFINKHNSFLFDPGLSIKTCFFSM